jgi:hypothetical protein
VEASAVDIMVLDWLIDQRLNLALKSVSLNNRPKPDPSLTRINTTAPACAGRLCEEHFSGCMKVARDAVLFRERILGLVTAHDSDYDPIRCTTAVAATVLLL